MLHITSSDTATRLLKRLGLPGTLLPWRDVLNEGPVQGEVSLETLSSIRARFLAANGWVDYESAFAEFTQRNRCLAGYLEHDEVVLWFGGDLGEQLQLIQLLHWFSQRDLEETRLTWVFFDVPTDFDTKAAREAPDTMTIFSARQEVTPAQLVLGKRAWSAFSSPDPRAIEALLQEDISALPALRSALRRHLEQFPALGYGLCRTARQILHAVDTGANETASLLRTAEGHERAPFLSDTVFWSYVTVLARGPHPLLRTGDGAVFQPPMTGKMVDARVQEVELTPAGVAVVQRRIDAIRLNGIDRWRGGVHLDHRQNHWRWDLKRQRLAPAAATQLAP